MDEKYQKQANKTTKKARKMSTYTNCSVPLDHVGCVGRRELEQLLVAPEYNHGNVNLTEHGQLMCLFKQAVLSFQKCPKVSIIKITIQGRCGSTAIVDSSMC